MHRGFIEGMLFRVVIFKERRLSYGYICIRQEKTSIFHLFFVAEYPLLGIPPVHWANPRGINRVAPWAFYTDFECFVSPDDELWCGHFQGKFTFTGSAFHVDSSTQIFQERLGVLFFMFSAIWSATVLSSQRPRMICLGCPSSSMSPASPMPFMAAVKMNGSYG